MYEEINKKKIKNEIKNWTLKMLCFASPFSRFFPIQFYPFLYFHILQLPKLNYRPLFTLPAATSSRSSPRDQRKTFSYMLFFMRPTLSFFNQLQADEKKKSSTNFYAKKNRSTLHFAMAKPNPTVKHHPLGLSA